jgi:dolichol kinase
VVIPRTGLERRLRRPGEGYAGGIRTYPLAVLGLVLLLPRAEAAAAWGVLAFGDAAAAAVGRAVPSRAILGHRKATWAGSLALLLVGFGAAFAMGGAVGALGARVPWVDPGPVPGALATLAAAAAATLADLLPIPPDDNLPCAAAAGLALALLG